MVSARQARVQRRNLRFQRLHDGGGLHARFKICLHRDGGAPVPAPDNRIFLAVIDRGDLAQGNGSPVRQRHLKRPDRCQRHALVGGGADQHVYEIDPAADLRDRDAGFDRIEGLGQIFRTQSQETGLVLVDPDPDGARWRHPVVVEVFCARGGSDRLSDTECDRAHAIRLNPAHPILHRPPDRRPELKWVDPANDVRKRGFQRLFELRLHPIALPQPFGDDDGLGEEIVGQLNVKRQIEPHGALPDIGGPMVHVLIAGQKLVDPRGGALGCVNRGVFRQLHVHDQLGAIR